ncbi:MAG: hypothetical protein Kow0042_31250 [Calditrichia bacterium]
MKTILWAFFILSFLMGGARSQENISVDLQLFNTSARVFYLGDVDPAGLGNAPDFFRLELRNDGAEPVEIELRFELRLNNVEIASAQSEPFSLPPGVFYYTNSQLNTGTAFIPGTNQEIQLQNYNVDFDKVNELKSQVLQTGKLPVGTWEFWMAWRRIESGIPVNTWVPDENITDNILVITNPTTIELLYPGNRVNEDVVMEVPTLFPYFIWQSDASSFNLYVFKKYTDDKSIQDVLSHDPVLHLRGYPNQVFQYPTDPSKLEFFDQQGNLVGESVGPIRMLESGEIYYWYVEAVVPSTANEVVLTSDVFKMKITSQEQTDMTSQLILIYLKQMLGDRFEPYLESLEGYEPTGGMAINGTTVDMNSLIELLNKISKGEVDIQNVYVE